MFVIQFKMEELALHIPKQLDGRLLRPILKPCLIPNCLTSFMPSALASPRIFEDHIRKHLGDDEVKVVDKFGERHTLTYNKVLDSGEDSCLAILDHLIPKGNPIVQSFQDFPQFSDDKYLEFLKASGRNKNASKFCILYTDKGFFTASHVDPFCTMGWMGLVMGRKTWYFWDPNDPSTLACWEDCMTGKGNTHLPQPSIKFVAEVGSMVFIPPGWLHAVHTSQKALGVCGSMLTHESLHHISKRWDWFTSVYQEDSLECFKDVKAKIGKIFDFPTSSIERRLQLINTIFDQHLESYDNNQSAGSKRGRKPGKRNTQRPKPLVKFGKKPHGGRQCQDPEHDPSKTASCGKVLSSYAYGFLISPVCGSCYKWNRQHKHFHYPMLPVLDM